MNSKSLEIIDKLIHFLENGAMSAEDFPHEDILKLIRYEYSIILNDPVQLEIIKYYSVMLQRAVTNNETDSIISVLKIVLYNLRILATLRIKVKEAEAKSTIQKFMKNSTEFYFRYCNRNSTLNKVAFTGNGVIYTVITGEYDKLHIPEYINDEFDYICFTDNPELKSDIWDIRLIVNNEGLDTVRLARKTKILVHKYLKDYDYSIYVDGKIAIIGDLKNYIDKYSKGSPLLCFPHFVRDCVYLEGESCVEYKKDKELVIRDQLEQYNKEGYPVHNGLVDTACIVRSHNNSQLCKVMDDWWNEVKTKSKRDQLSFGYSCWKNNFNYDICNLFVYNNEYICKRREWEPPY